MEVTLNMNGSTEEFMQALESFMKVTSSSSSPSSSKREPLTPNDQTGPIGLNQLTPTQILQIQTELHLRKTSSPGENARPNFPNNGEYKQTLSPSVNNKIESIFNSSDLSLHELKKPAKTEEGILGFHYTGPKPEQEREYLNKIGYGSGSSPESDTTLLAFSSEWMKEDESFCMGLQKYPSLEIDWDAIDKLSGSV
ncbi:hypothetical protein Bca52824_029774 [Brassica carinata]|uniref:Uncharacterized protein n=1 Tax=Brassica carinata TaxID=52824 RepID=A0A8X7S7H7_BRACI|nr:hypothetical protein Bca52824_029774 [Brassica carinata]